MGLELLGQNASPTMKEEISRSVNELDQLVGEILLASRLDSQQADVGPLENVDFTGLACEECVHFDVPLDLGADGYLGWGTGSYAQFGSYNYGDGYNPYSYSLGSPGGAGGGGGGCSQSDVYNYNNIFASAGTQGAVFIWWGY